MATVYLVTTGNYSDYQVRAICSTMEKAKHAQDVFGGNRNDVIDIEIDDLPETPNGFYRYKVPMNRAGEVEIYGWDDIPLCDDPDEEGEEDHYSEISSGMIFSVYARDCKHAIKVANERRIMLLAEGKWPKGKGDV